MLAKILRKTWRSKNVENRFRTLVAGFIVLTSLGVGCQEAPKQKMPNILFILSDDQGPNNLGVLNPEIHTPNLDKLAKEGMLFTQAYNQGSHRPAVCAASRAMLITGRNLWKAAEYTAGDRTPGGNLPKEILHDSIARNEVTGYWPLEMKAAGYDTYFTGKWHINQKVENLFDHVGTVRGGMPRQTEARYDRKFIEGEPDTWHPWDTSFGGFWQGGPHWSEVVYHETRGFLRKASESGNPFFMYVAFNAPHDPRQSPKEFVDMYPLSKISVPESFMPEYPYAEEVGSGRTLRDERLAPFPRTEYAVKKNIQEYYAIISHMDHQIGRILKELKETGQDENTYIVFTSDHGLAVGDHGFLGKQNMYDASMRVPLIIKGPGIKKNKKTDEFVYLQDVMPTALEIAGVPKPDYVDFHSFLPMATGQADKSAYDAVYGAYMGKQRMIRSKKYKMMIYPGANVVRLFDMEKDPFEMNDLASNPDFRSVVDEYFEEFKKLQERVYDPLDVTLFYERFFEN